ncbi:MAG TPA: hypothetical protein VF046_00155 [Gemmatimonadales bacterium]
MIATLEAVRPPGRVLQPTRRLVVELAGPAAAGKTSLLLALGGGDRQLHAGLRVPRHMHIATALSLAPTFLALHRPYGGLLRKEMKRITYLGSLSRLLQDGRPTQDGAVILDEGAVYMLARLQVFGADRIRSAAYARWWRGAIEAWARMLDLIVWLDAPDPILRARLRGRRQPHPAKALPDDGIDRFIATYRESYRRVVRALVEARGPEVLVIRTDRESVAQIARRIEARVRELEATGS